MPRSAPASPDPTYLLGSSDAERRRLLAQCGLLRDAARQLLDRLPLAEPARAIDVGCGPLGVLDLLSDKVGRSGTVVGLDNDERMIDWAAKSIAELGLANVTTTLGTLPCDDELPFDLTHCRLLLINSASPEALVASMAAATRTGGWIAMQEFDWAAWHCEPPHPAWDELKSLLVSVFGGDVHIGARLPTLLREAGCQDVQVAAHAFYWQPGDLYQTLLLYFADLFEERIRACGIDPRTLTGMTHELGRHLARPTTIVRESLLVQAWGRKA
ncbi:methyltransferase domain-containing protein [Nonomuraea sp. NPDC050404]|uniref:methyltransferase domain-containing protein n=1 Tax=Nonomuraea sp. NPDC050404 TaxID=3155783 RepID=UPI0033FFB233